MFSISARLEANLELNDLLAAYGQEKGGRVQRFITYTHRRPAKRVGGSAARIRWMPARAGRGTATHFQ